MNSKGFLFTVMIFILIGALLVFYQGESRLEASSKLALSESNVFRAVSDKFANMNNNLSNLATSDAEEETTREATAGLSH